jgi:hypothetical protein
MTHKSTQEINRRKFFAELKGLLKKHNVEIDLYEDTCKAYNATTIEINFRNYEEYGYEEFSFHFINEDTNFKGDK